MIAYLDNSATTRPSQPVIEAMTQAMREGFYNPSSLYAPAMAAEKALNRCRAAIQSALKVDQGRVIFTSGGTEANNLALFGGVGAMHGPQHVMVSAVEHPSVLAAAQALEKEGHRLTLLRVDRAGQLDWEQLESVLTRDPPALVSVMQVNNETGAVSDIPRLSAMLRALAPQALLHVDGVQAFLRLPIDGNLVDMYTLSGHKIMGPKGIGALWVRRGVRLLPRQIGGGQEGEYRSGTENTPGIAGLLSAIQTMDPQAPAAMMAMKLRLAQGLLQRVPGLVINGPDPKLGAPHILNASFPGVRGEVMLHALEGEGVYVSTGSACSSKKRKVSGVLLSMGIPAGVAEGALRFSLAADNDCAQIDYACEKAGALYQALKGFRRK